MSPTTGHVARGIADYDLDGVDEVLLGGRAVRAGRRRGGRGYRRLGPAREPRRARIGDAPPAGGVPRDTAAGDTAGRMRQRASSDEPPNRRCPTLPLSPHEGVTVREPASSACSSTTGTSGAAACPPARCGRRRRYRTRGARRRALRGPRRLRRSSPSRSSRSTPPTSSSAATAVSAGRAAAVPSTRHETLRAGRRAHDAVAAVTLESPRRLTGSFGRNWTWSGASTCSAAAATRRRGTRSGPSGADASRRDRRPLARHGSAFGNDHLGRAIDGAWSHARLTWHPIETIPTPKPASSASTREARCTPMAGVGRARDVGSVVRPVRRHVRARRVPPSPPRRATSTS